MTPPIPSNEKARLDALRHYQILDTAPEQAFDDITQLAAFICNAPIALMTLLDEKRQWFKSKVGLATDETPRNDAFCAHAILETKVMIVEDATKDPRFANNPLVLGDPYIRFYAGAPLRTPGGHGLGSLCVIDREPRQLSGEQSAALQSLARLVVTQLELRRVSQELADAATQLKTLNGLLPMCAHCKGIRDDQGYWKQVEEYIETRTDVSFSHGICPDCRTKYFPDFKFDDSKNPIKP